LALWDAYKRLLQTFRDFHVDYQNLTVFKVHRLGNQVYGHPHKQGNGDQLAYEPHTACYAALLAIRSLERLWEREGLPVTVNLWTPKDSAERFGIQVIEN
jgi:hypothetical protein